MTSKKSLWVNRLENHKRRIVVWILAILGNLLVYPVLLLMYYARVRARYARGNYKGIEDFRQAMKQVTCNALCFQSYVLMMACTLAVLIVVHGFSYLYSKNKQDLYLSVPVSMKDRFKIIYINGVVIYLITSAVSLLAALGLAVFEGVIDGNLLGRICLSYLFCFLFFLCVYNLVLVALMLTGNIVMTGAGTIVLLLYGTVVVNLVCDYRRDFYERYTAYFQENAIPSLFLPDLYFEAARKIYYVQATGKAFTLILPHMGGMLLYAAVTLALAYCLYTKRPSEAAGKPIAFRVVKPVLKVLMIIPAALLAGELVYDLTEQSVAGLICAIIACGILFGMAVEVIFETDIRAAFGHFVLTIMGTCAAFAVFGVIKWDIFGYDSYVPRPEEVESYAVFDSAVDGGRNDHWVMVSAEDSVDWGSRVYGSGIPSVTPGNPYYAEVIQTDEYIKEHMFLTDAEAICTLANKTAGVTFEDLPNRHVVNVLYRLKNGRKVARAVWFNFDDVSSEPFLNRIYGAAEYVDGIYQAAHMDELERDILDSFTYTNGIRVVGLDTGDAQAKRVVNAWLNDRKRSDFTYFRNHLPISQLELSFKSYREIALPVYEDFTETRACLEQQESFLAENSGAENISHVIITHYNHEQYEDVYYSSMTMNAAAMGGTGKAAQAEYKDKQQIAEIMEAAYSSSFPIPYNDANCIENDYSIEVYLNPMYLNSDEDVSVETGTVRYFIFLSGKVPDFVRRDVESN